ncbi:unnamed protein product, partial [Scytosiphon promiscuus]
GIFEDLTALTTLRLNDNSRECLPTTILGTDGYRSYTGFYGTEYDGYGLYITVYGDECGCDVPGVTENVCGEEKCTPGPVGYIC